MAQTNPGPIQQKPTTAPVQTQPTAAQQINTAMQNASAQQPTPAPVAAPTTPSAPMQTMEKRQKTPKNIPTPNPNAPKQQFTEPPIQSRANAQTTQEALGGTYFVGSNGSGQKGLKAGDQVVTSGGTYMIASVNPDGSYQTRLVNKDQTLENYTGSYNNHSGNIYRTVPGTDNAPKGLKVGDQVVTSGGTYTINGVMPDGSYKSFLSNRAQTLENYGGQYATAPGATPQQPQTPDYARKYDPNMDYTAEINKAIAAGDFVAAAALEMLRREKIKGEGLEDKYALTDTFAHLYDQVTPEMLVQLQGGYTSAASARQNPWDKWKDRYTQMQADAEQQARNEIDYATEQSIREAERAKEDAQPLFQQQLDQNDIDTAKAMSNSALYAEARGDRGGIGQSQYNEIQAAGLRNRQAINTARTKLATDTARQVADYRSKGNFELGQRLFELRQEAFRQLQELEQRSVSWMMTQQEFDQELAQWEFNKAVREAELTGEYDGKPTWSAQKYEVEQLADAGKLALQLGQMPTDEQLAALGLTPTQAQGYLWAQQMGNFSSGGSSSGGGSPGSSSSGNSGNGNNGSGNNGNGATKEKTYQNEAALAKVVNDMVKAGAPQSETQQTINRLLRADQISGSTAEKLRQGALRGTK